MSGEFYVSFWPKFTAMLELVHEDNFQFWLNITGLFFAVLDFTGLSQVGQVAPERYLTNWMPDVT
jgi:hypothetical protein